MATTIPTLANGGLPSDLLTPLSAAQHNAYGNVWKALGVTDDNSGAPLLTRSVSSMIPWLFGGDPNLRTAALLNPARYTIPSGQAFVALYQSGVSAVTITPSGQSLIAFQSAGSNVATTDLRCELPFGPGDVIDLPDATAGLPPFVGFSATLPVGVTPIIRSVTNANTYTVDAGKALLITWVSVAGAGYSLSNTTTPTTALQVGGVDTLYPATTGPTSRPEVYKPLVWAGAGQVVRASSATPITFAGYVLG